MTDANSRLANNTAFGQIEEAFYAALDVSLDPRGPDSLYDVVARLGLPGGTSAVDVGCGRGRHAIELAQRFGFDVLGVDPVDRHQAAVSDAAQLSLATGSVRFAEGTAEAIPVEASSIDFIWCRESLMYADLGGAAAEFSRVLRPGGRGLVYLVLSGPLMTDAEADDFWGSLAPRSFRPDEIEQALTGAGFAIDERVDYASEWGERRQEQEGAEGRMLLFAARLIRQPERYITRFGQANYDIMLGDCYWHVYRMLGKLSGYACVFTKP